jgi:hypothetical protein
MVAGLVYAFCCREELLLSVVQPVDLGKTSFYFVNLSHELSVSLICDCVYVLLHYSCYVPMCDAWLLL